MLLRIRVPRFMTRSLHCLVFLAFAFAGPAAALGGNQGQARRALEKGEIRPLEQVPAVVRAREPGGILALKLERESGQSRYEIMVLTPSGQRREIEIDANTLAILKNGKDD